MGKVVINGCYGGFSLSRKALYALRELGCKAALEETDTGEMYPDGSGPRTDLSPRLASFCRDIPRDDPHLIQVVQLMGEEANGGCADLQIVEIPDGVEWTIEEYDGNEHVAEKHRTWR